MLDTLFQPSPISLLWVHLNGIGNVSIHLNVPDNYEFHTNVSSLRLFLQSITCTYDLVNGTDQHFHGYHNNLCVSMDTRYSQRTT